jgi:monofunctional biosynthetic peptidoglycan transglycosylase
LIAIGFTFLQILLLNLFNPFTTSVILQRHIESIFGGKKPIRYEWYNYEEISKQMTLAVISSEDQNFPDHFGFDIEQINKALKENKTRRRIRGASTITQQVAKNLFLWNGKSFIRKGLEAYYTVLLELLCSKKKIIEIYLNIAEMGDNIFGVSAASSIYFSKKPKLLTAGESALIAAVLPRPAKYSVKHPSGYIRKRQDWILKQMSSLGGVSYITDL